MEHLPQKWAIKALNRHEARIIANYITPLSLAANCSAWNVDDALSYYARVKDGKYEGGARNTFYNSTLISFSDFERLVLNKNIEPKYEIY